MSYQQNPLEQYKRISSLYDKEKSEDASFQKLPQGSKNLRKVAQFMLLLGPEEGAEVLKNLNQDEIEIICQEMTVISGISKEEAQDILQEFGVRLQFKEEFAHGGRATAKDMLEKAFGKDAAQDIIERVLPPELPDPFSFLEPVELPQLLHLLKDESIPTISVILAHLEAEKSAAVINTFDPEEATQLLMRMGRLKQVDPIVVDQVAQAIKSKLDLQGKWDADDVDGKQVLADIMKHLDRDKEQALLNQLSQVDQGLEEELKDKIFTLDRIVFLREKDLRNALKTYSDKDIAMLLRDKKETFKEYILSAFSQRRQTLIHEEDQILGKVLRKDVDQLTKTLLTQIREKVESGDYHMMDKEDYI